MKGAYDEPASNVFGVEECGWEDVSSYRMVRRGEGRHAGFAIDDMIEKLKRDGASSNLSISGRYILQPEKFAISAEQTKCAGGGIRLTDAILVLMESEPFSDVKYEGDTREDFLKESRKFYSEAARVQLLHAVAAK